MNSRKSLPMGELLQLLTKAGTLPRNRCECDTLPRPCPNLGCKFHLWIDHKEFARLLASLATGKVNELPPSCVLDVAQEGEHSTEEVGAILGLTGERVRQIEKHSLGRLNSALMRANIHVDAADLLTAYFCSPEGAEVPVRP